MLFNSLAFAIFMTVVFFVYWLVPSRLRYVVTAVASCFFYICFGIRYLPYIVISAVISYAGALIMQREERTKRRLYLAVSVALTAGFLIFFKYVNFLEDTLLDILAYFGLKLNVKPFRYAAPVGISFYTFKIVSYLVEVYRGRITAQRNFVKYAAYVSFFPQVASGPIERPYSFFESMEEDKKFSYDTAAYSLKLMAWGFFKKMIIADKLAGYVNKVFTDVSGYGGFALLIAAVFYSVQIYCDFSGYSDIANGSAGLLGYKRVRNFDSPYFSASVKEFWSRWHISLSTWLRDYIYIPMGGNRAGKLKYIRNIMTTFLISGLWHGASWTFVVWGALHGAMQVIETFAHNIWARLNNRDPRDRTHTPKGIVRVVRICLVFIFATAAWVLFRAETFGDAMYVFTHMFTGAGSPVQYVKAGFSALGINGKMFAHIAVVIGMLSVFDFVSLKKDVIAYTAKLPVVVRWGIYVLFVDVVIIWFLKYGADSGSFVYFDF